MTTEKNNRARWLQGPSAVCDAAPSEFSPPWRLILLGAPGVGKGTQADLLGQRLGACHLSTGDVFRAAGSRCDCDQTPAMREAREYMRRGALVPDSTVWEMVRERSACLCCAAGFILDGFPRTVAQAEALKLRMEKEELTLSAAVNYELPLAEIVKRLSGRRTCESCRSVFHVINQPPTQEGVCDRCHGRLYQREDDRPESITVRLDAYTQSTAPLIHFYQSLGLLVSIPAGGSPNEIFERTIVALGSPAVRSWSGALPPSKITYRAAAVRERVSAKSVPRPALHPDPGSLHYPQ
jgi:adenylate kinase